MEPGPYKVREVCGIVVAEDLHGSRDDEEDEETDEKHVLAPEPKQFVPQGHFDDVVDAAKPKTKRMKQREKRVFQKTNDVLVAATTGAVTAGDGTGAAGKTCGDQHDVFDDRDMVTSRSQSQPRALRRSTHDKHAGDEDVDQKAARKRKKPPTKMQKLLLDAAQYGELLPFVNAQRRITEWNLDFTDEYGWNLLMIACTSGHHDVINWLLNNVAAQHLGVFRTDGNGRTCAGLAAFGGHVEIAEQLQRFLESHPCVDDIDATISSYQAQTRDADVSFRGDEGLQTCDSAWYCEACEKTVCGPRGEHLTSVMHNFAKQHTVRNAPFQLNSSNRGYRLLVASGWDEYSGLGRDGQGIRVPVKTVRKETRAGVGVRDAAKSTTETTKPSVHKVHAEHRRQQQRERELRHMLS